MKAYNISTYQVDILRSMLSEKVITVNEGQGFDCHLVDYATLFAEKRINIRSVKRMVSDRVIARDIQSEKRLSGNVKVYKITEIGVRAVNRNGLDIYR